MRVKEDKSIRSLYIYFLTPSPRALQINGGNKVEIQLLHYMLNLKITNPPPPHPSVQGGGYMLFSVYDNVF